MFMSTFKTAFQFTSSQTNKMSEYNTAGSPTQQFANDEIVHMTAQPKMCDGHPQAVSL
jgi:hypothetical protein